MALARDIEHLVEHNLRFKDNIGKYIRVKTVDTNQHEGWLKCIDPITGNFFLITFDDDFKEIRSLTLIMGDSYSGIEVLKDSDENVKSLLERNPVNRKTLESENPEQDPPENASDRKKNLVAWIKKNRLPVFQSEEDESLIVGGNVTVKPPYDVESCSSFNARTLKRIREIVAQLPSYDRADNIQDGQLTNS